MSNQPAKHVYDLGEKWRRFAGQAGMADGHPGSVVFVIRCDGHEKWRSKTIKLGTRESFDLDLSDAQQLELVVENSGDGNGADWGVWLEPVLSR